MFNALITQHVGDIYADDHTHGVTVYEGPLDLGDPAVELPAFDATASVETLVSPTRPTVITFVGRWTDADGVRHGLQLPLDFDVNVYDFGHFRAIVTVS